MKKLNVRKEWVPCFLLSEYGAFTRCDHVSAFEILRVLVTGVFSTSFGTIILYLVLCISWRRNAVCVVESLVDHRSSHGGLSLWLIFELWQASAYLVASATGADTMSDSTPSIISKPLLHT